MRRSFVFFCCALLVGCGSKQDERIPKVAGLPDAPGLHAKLVGKWEMKSRSDTKTLEFTSGKTVILQSYAQHVGTLELNKSELTLKDRNGWSDTYGLEFGSEGELVLRPAGTGHGVKSLFDGLEGRWQRTSPPPAQFDEKGNTGPLADAKGTVSKFEKKRLALEPLLEKAFADRDDLVAKLRDAGIKTPADLKNNFRGQQLAGSLQRLSGEIDGLERQIAAIDTAILEAKAVVRRMEREQAGISEDEMRKLAEQLRDAEERTDGAGKLVTPLDVEATLEKALKATPRASGKSKIVTATEGNNKRLVGKWQLAEGKRKGTVEFTKGGTALVVWSDGLRNALGESERRATLKYSLAGKALKLEEPGDGEYRQKCDVQIEIISDDEMIFVNQKNSLSFDWLDGRVKRVK